MKAITLWQPWASLIAMGAKTIETRTHRRFAFLEGKRIAIHAGKAFDHNAWAILECCANRTGGEPLRPLLDLPWMSRSDECPWSCVVCTARVVETRRLTDADTIAACFPAHDRFGLVLDDIVRLDPPVPCSGHQGVWEWREGR